MPKGLEIPIGAPLDQLTKDLNGANTKVKQFEAQVNNSLSKAGTVAGKSTKDFTNLSRVIQDLPFGFIGISNNLTQLIPGVGALGLAFSALVAGLTFLQTGTDNWTRGLGNNKKAVDNLKLSGDEYSKTLTGIAQAQLKGTQDAQSELTNLSILYKTYTSNIASLETRKKAYEQLQSLYPAYFGNLKFEKDATDKTEGAYNKLTTAILATARARASADKIAENSSKQLENESKIADIETQLTKATKERVSAQKKLSQTSNITGEEMFYSAQSDAFVRAGEAEKALLSQRRVLVTANNKLLVDNLTLEKNINSQIAKGAELTGKLGAANKEAAKEKMHLNPAIGYNNGSPLSQLTPFESPLKDTSQLSKLTAKAGQKILRENIAIATEAATNYATSLMKVLDDLNARAATTINGGLADTFAGIGEAIATSLSTGANIASTLGASLLSSLGSVLGQLGQMAIATGVAILGIKTALKTLNPFAAIGAGVALLALSGVVRHAANKMSGNIGGGGGGGSIASPGQGVSIGGSSSVNSGSYSGGTVVFEISGVNLIGVLNRAGAKLVRYGG